MQQQPRASRFSGGSAGGSGTVPSSGVSQSASASLGNKQFLNASSPMRQSPLQRGVPAPISPGPGGDRQQQQFDNRKPQAGARGNRSPAERGTSPRMEQRNSVSAEAGAPGGGSLGASLWDSAGGSGMSFLLPQRQGGGGSPVVPGGQGMPADATASGVKAGSPDRISLDAPLDSGSGPATSSRGPGAHPPTSGVGTSGGRRALTPPGSGGGGRSPSGGLRGRDGPMSGVGLSGSLRVDPTGTGSKQRGAVATASETRRSPPGSVQMQVSPSTTEPRPGSMMQVGSGSGFGLQGAGTVSSSSLQGRERQVTPKAERSTTPTQQQSLGLRKQGQSAEVPSQGSTGVEFEAVQNRLRELESTNTSLEKKLDEDGSLFVEALLTLEMQIEDLTKQNRKLIDEREQMERGLQQQGAEGELRARISKLEREQEDFLGEMDKFEKEKEEDLRVQREEVGKLRKQLDDEKADSRRRFSELERDRESMVQMVAMESQEAEVRIEKLVREKDALNTELAKALARAEAAGGTDENGQAGGGKTPSSGSLSEANSQLRQVMGEREALKDEVTNKNGQLLLLQSQLEIKDRKLRIADMENAMLKSELEVLRRNAATK